MQAEKSDTLLNITNLLNSMKEVESYIITDMEGKIHIASSENYTENMINSSIYLCVIGSQVSGEFNMGEPGNIIYYLKTRKMLIQKHNEFIIILNLIDVTKFTDFKKKLKGLFYG